MKTKAAHTWEQQPQGWYVEPRKVTVQLLQVETFHGAIHDPCCGLGNIVTILRCGGYHATGSDLVQRVEAPWHMGVSDFTNHGGGGLFGAPNCVFNPPYFRGAGLVVCIIRALELTTGKVCAFAPLRFLTGEKRANSFYRDQPPHRVWIVTPRPSCPPGEYILRGEKPEGGTPDYCWMVWDAGSPTGDTKLGWLR